MRLATTIRSSNSITNCSVCQSDAFLAGLPRFWFEGQREKKKGSFFTLQASNNLEKESKAFTNSLMQSFI